MSGDVRRFDAGHGRVALLDLKLDEAGLARDVARARQLGGQYWVATERWLKAHGRVPGRTVRFT